MRKIDLLCENYMRAAENRRMVALKLNIHAYLVIEDQVRRWPKKKPLPPQIIGVMPAVGKWEAKTLHGFHEVKI